MLHIEPTSQFKFIAKPSPIADSSVVGETAAKTTTTVSPVPVGSVSLQANTATHFQAPEHLQNKTLQNKPATSTTEATTAGVVVNAALGLTYDGKRMRKAVQRRTVDYNSSIIRFLETRKWFKNSRNQYAIQPKEIYNIDVVPPAGYIKNPMNAVTTKFVRTSTNKLRCPIFCVVWTPEGRRLVTGASSGEFTLWNGLTFNFETILQAHDRAVRSMVWSHHDTWLLTGDHGGFVKYWQSNMNNVKMYEAHKEPIRGLSFSPSDSKFASCSDDGLVKVWDFYRCIEERQLKGHGADVKCVDWHPSKGLLVSGSKDSQQPVKLWDPKSGVSISTLHCHKSTVMTAKWNSNGNWLLTGSRDHLLKLFDIRMMKELQTFRGHKKEATAVSWHPVHETLFASGGSDGSLMFWLTGVDEKAGAMEKAHEGIVWSLAWHPVGHILCSGSNDHTSKFWTRNRPGDAMKDRYNLDIQTTSEDDEYSDGLSSSVLPGLAAFNSSAVIPGVGVPVTASSVVLPASTDSGHEEKQLYSQGIPNPPLSSRSSNISQPRGAVLGMFPPGKLGPPNVSNAGQTRPQGTEANRGMSQEHPRPPAHPAQPGFIPGGERMQQNQPQFRPQQLRPPFGPRPNRPIQYNPGPRPGLDLRAGPLGSGFRDPNINFRPSAPFPPNQFMRFPGPRDGPPRGPNFVPRAMNEHPRDLPRGPRPDFGSQPNEQRLGDQRDRENTTRDNEEQRGVPEKIPDQGSLANNNRPPPELRESDSTAPGILGDYQSHREAESRLRNRGSMPGEAQGFRRKSFEDTESNSRTAHDSRVSGKAPDGPGPGHSFGRQNSRGGPPFESREQRDRFYDGPAHGPPHGPPHEAPERGRSFDRSEIGRPREGPPHANPDMRRPGEGPPRGRPEIPRPGESLPHERPDMLLPREGPSNERPDMTWSKEGPPPGRPNMGRPVENPAHVRPEMRRPKENSPHERPDIGRPREGLPLDRPDMGRLREGTGRPREGLPQDRPDMGRPREGPPHDRPSMGRPREGPSRDRPDMGRPRDVTGRPRDVPPQERSDLGRPREGPPHDRPTIGHSGTLGAPDISEGQPRDRPDMGRAREAPPHDMGHSGKPGILGPGIYIPGQNAFPMTRPDFRNNPEMGRMDHGPPRMDRRGPPDRLESGTERPERGRDPPNVKNQNNIPSLMQLMPPQPGSMTHPPGPNAQDNENRGRKRPIDRDYDRPPKRIEPNERGW